MGGELSTAADSPLVSLEVQANGFLYNMVRNIVGTLLEVGRGKYPPQWIDEVLAARRREVAGPTAPPHGLFLKEVHYEPFDLNAGPNTLGQTRSA